MNLRSMAATYLDDENAIVFLKCGNIPLVQFLTKFCKHPDVKEEDIEHVITICGNRVVYLKTKHLSEKIDQIGEMFLRGERPFRFTTKLALPRVPTTVEKSRLKKALQNYGKVSDMKPSCLPDGVYQRWLIDMYLQKPMIPKLPEELQVEILRRQEIFQLEVECSHCQDRGHHVLICPNANENRQTEYRRSVELSERNRDRSQEMLTEKDIKRTDQSSRFDDPGPSGLQGIRLKGYSSAEGIPHPRKAPQFTKERICAKNIPSTTTGMEEMSEAMSDDAAPPGKKTKRGTNRLSYEEYSSCVRKITEEIYAKGILSKEKLYIFFINARNSKKFPEIVKKTVGKDIHSFVQQLKSQKTLIQSYFPETAGRRPLKNIISTMSNWIRKLEIKKRKRKSYSSSSSSLWRSKSVESVACKGRETSDVTLRNMKLCDVMQIGGKSCDPSSDDGEEKHPLEDLLKKGNHRNIS